MKFSDYQRDEQAQASFKQMKEDLAQAAALHCIDYAAAADPKQRRPLELYVDACDIGWGGTLAQRPPEITGPDGKLMQGAPKPIAVYSKSYNETEQAWSTFERELCGLKESLAVVEHLVKGFPITVYTDHKNNIFTDSLYANKLLARKLLRCALEIEEMGLQVKRVWIKGVANILGDAPSRHPVDRDAVLDLRVPAGPLRRIVQAMFHHPDVLDEEIAKSEAFLDGLANLGNPQQVTDNNDNNQCDLDATMGGCGNGRRSAEDGSSQVVKDDGRDGKKVERKGKSIKRESRAGVADRTETTKEEQQEYGNASHAGPEAEHSIRMMNRRFGKTIRASTIRITQQATSIGMSS